MSPLRIPAFRSYLLLRFCMATGWHMQGLIVGWTVYSLTKDPLMLGMVGLAEAIPAIGAALPMGYVVDRLNKKVSLVVAAIVIALSAVATGLLVQEWSVDRLGVSTSITMILAMVVLNGFARSMYSPSMFSLLSVIAPRDLLARATAMGSTVWQAAMVLGPMVAGLLYGSLGVGSASLLTVAVMMVGLVGLVGIPSAPPVQTSEKKHLRTEVTAGLRFILGNQVVFGALLLDMLAVLFGGAVAILPVFASDVLLVDASGLGILRAAPSVGSVLVMAYLSARTPTRNTGRILLLAVTGFGLATLGFALSTVFWLSAACLVLVGGFDAVSVVVRSTILQLYTPDDMRGRVAAANTMFISSSNEIGALESGVAARVMGAVPSVIFGATITLLVVAGVALKAPKLRNLELTTQ